MLCLGAAAGAADVVVVAVVTYCTEALQQPAGQ
jgi:hypothetical protein